MVTTGTGGGGGGGGTVGVVVTGGGGGLVATTTAAGGKGVCTAGRAGGGAAAAAARRAIAEVAIVISCRSLACSVKAVESLGPGIVVQKTSEWPPVDRSPGIVAAPTRVTRPPPKPAVAWRFWLK